MIFRSRKFCLVVFASIAVIVVAVTAYFLGRGTAEVVANRKTRQMRSELTAAVLEKMGTGLAVGGQLPDGEFEDLDGVRVRVGELACDKTLIVYMESQCGHCINQIKTMSRYFVGGIRPCGIIVSNITADGFREFIDEYGIDCQLLCDINGQYKDALQIMSFPSNFIVDRNLQILDVVMEELSEDEIKGLTKEMARQ